MFCGDTVTDLPGKTIAFGGGATTVSLSHPNITNLAYCLVEGMPSRLRSGAARRLPLPDKREAILRTVGCLTEIGVKPARPELGRCKAEQGLIASRASERPSQDARVSRALAHYHAGRIYRDDLVSEVGDAREPSPIDRPRDRHSRRY